MVNPEIRRLSYFLYLFSFGFLFLLVNLFHLQVIQGKRYRRMADLIYHQRKQRLLAQRGSIFDRNGRLLAFSEITGLLLIDWTHLKGDTLAQALTLIREYFPEIELTDNPGPKKKFLRGIRYEAGKEFNQVLRKKGLSRFCGVSWDFIRHYPFPYFTSVLGEFSETEKRGLWGLEAKMEKFLRGRDGFVIYQKDAWGRAYPYPSYLREEPEKGGDLYLTLDKAMTEISFEELAKGVKEFGAKKGSVLILDCETGEILAMVDYPIFDKSVGFLRPYSLLWEFEPGSVFKLLIACACLESEDWKKFFTQPYDLSSGEVWIGGEPIREYRNKKFGLVSFSDIFVFSSNCGVALLSSSLPPLGYYSLLLNFGFGSFTQVELEERRGYLPALSSLREGKGVNPHLYANNAFGQGLRVTLLQLSLAYLAVANDGLLLRPYLIKEGRKNGEVVFRGEKMVIRRVVSERTAKMVREILHQVCERGTGRDARIEGVSVCGKTGTAEKPWEKGRGYSEKTITTFIGFFPKEKPKYLIAVMLDEPEGAAAENAAVLFRRIGERVFFLPREINEILARSGL